MTLKPATHLQTSPVNRFADAVGDESVQLQSLQNSNLAFNRKKRNVLKLTLAFNLYNVIRENMKRIALYFSLYIIISLRVEIL